MGQFSLAKLFGVTIRESANDGSDFTNPDADYRRLFLGEDGQLHVKDSSGTVTDIGSGGSGDVATDAIWDAAGDLAVGSGANTAAKLSIGATNGMALQRIGGAVAWGFPPGYLYNHTAFTSDVSVTATSSATANTIVTASAGIALDGSTAVWIEFDCKALEVPASEQFLLDLYDDTGGGAASIDGLRQITEATASTTRDPAFCRILLTPSNATHTFSIRGWVTGGTGKALAGAGGAATTRPGHIAIIKA